MHLVTTNYSPCLSQIADYDALLDSQEPSPTQLTAATQQQILANKTHTPTVAFEKPAVAAAAARQQQQLRRQRELLERQQREQQEVRTATRPNAYRFPTDNAPCV